MVNVGVHARTLSQRRVNNSFESTSLEVLEGCKTILLATKTRLQNDTVDNQDTLSASTMYGVV